MNIGETRDDRIYTLESYGGTIKVAPDSELPSFAELKNTSIILNPTKETDVGTYKLKL